MPAQPNRMYDYMQEATGLGDANFDLTHYVPEFNQYVPSFKMSDYWPSYTTEETTASETPRPKHWIVAHINQLTMENADLTAKIAQLTEEQKKDKEVNEQLTSKFGDIEKMVEKVKQMSDKKIKKYSDKAHELEALLENAEQETKQLLDEKNKLEEELQAKPVAVYGSEECEALNTANDELRTKILRYTQLLLKSQEKNKELQQAVARMRDEYIPKVEVAGYMKKLAYMERKNQVLQKQLSELQRQYSTEDGMPPPNYVRREEVDKMKAVYEEMLQKNNSLLEYLLDNTDQIAADHDTFWNREIEEGQQNLEGAPREERESAHVAGIEYARELLRQQKENDAKTKSPGEVATVDSARMLPSRARARRARLYYPVQAQGMYCLA